MTHMNENDRVIIQSNPHHPAAERIVGTVVALYPKAGFMGCDLIDVEYENPRDGETYVRPFADTFLSPANPELLRAMADRYEALAAELRADAERAAR